MGIIMNVYDMFGVDFCYCAVFLQFVMLSSHGGVGDPGHTAVVRIWDGLHSSSKYK